MNPARVIEQQITAGQFDRPATNADLVDLIVDGGESAKSLNRPGIARLLALVDAGQIEAVIIAKLDRLTRSVKDLCTLLERLERRRLAPISVAESLDTGSAAGRLVLGGQPVGTRSDRGTDPGRHAPETQPRPASRKHRIRPPAC